MKYRFKGLDVYIRQLENISDYANTEIAVENAVDAGGKVVAEYTVAELNALPTDDDPHRKDHRDGIRSIEKKFLISTFGTSPIENRNDFINEKTGVNKEIIRYRDMSGYTPAVVLARRLENGTSYLSKNPVFARASRKARKPCIEAMQESFNRDINKCFENYQKKLQRSK